MKDEWGEPWVLASKDCGDIHISVLLQTQQSRCQLSDHCQKKFYVHSPVCCIAVFICTVCLKLVIVHNKDADCTSL
jgi:hypothetical protein